MTRGEISEWYDPYGAQWGRDLTRSQVLVVEVGRAETAQKHADFGGVNGNSVDGGVSKEIMWLYMQFLVAVRCSIRSQKVKHHGPNFPKLTLLPSLGEPDPREIRVGFGRFIFGNVRMSKSSSTVSTASV